MPGDAPPRLGKYQLVKRLATGGMAEVYLARTEGPGGFEKTVVLKRVLPHLAEEENFINMFFGEAKLVAQFSHPNVVQVFDFGEEAGSYFLVMEFIDGPNLRHLFKRAFEQGQPLGFATVAKIISYACEGLAYAHDFCDPNTGEPLRLVHRDISPDNILIARNGSVKVVDFGIAKAANSANLTRTGTVKGKFSYMAPEQLRAEDLDKRSDVFALGICLFELLTGKKPFDNSNDANVVRAILYEPMRRAKELRPDVPDALQAIIDKALEKDASKRYQDCRALQADLEKFIVSIGEPVTQFSLAQTVTALAGPPVTLPGVPTPRPSPVKSPSFSPVPIGSVPVVPPPAPPDLTREPVIELEASAIKRKTATPIGALSPVAEVATSATLSLKPPPKQAGGSRAVGFVLAAVVGAAATGAVIVWHNHDSAKDKPQLVAVAAPPPAKPEEPKPAEVKAEPKEPQQLPAPAAETAPSPPPTEPPRPTAKTIPHRSPPRHEPPPPALAAAMTKTGAKAEELDVEFRVRPFGSVYVDGKFLGDTPFAPAKLTAGVHQVRVVNHDLDKDVSRAFEVKTGASNIFRLNFEE